MAKILELILFWPQLFNQCILLTLLSLMINVIHVRRKDTDIGHI